MAERREKKFSETGKRIFFFFVDFGLVDFSIILSNHPGPPWQDPAWTGYGKGKLHRSPLPRDG